MSPRLGIWAHFLKLGQFRGREDRASFWPYAAVAFGIVMIVGTAMFVPIMMDAMREMREFAVAHPDQASVTSGPGQYSISISGDHPSFFPEGPLRTYLVVTFGLSVVLYAAAVARRLHDRGKSGFWGAMPLPFVIYSSAVMPEMLASAGEPDARLFFSVFLSNLLYIGTLIWLIVMLAGPSKPEEAASTGQTG